MGATRRSLSATNRDSISSCVASHRTPRQAGAQNDTYRSQQALPVASHTLLRWAARLALELRLQPPLRGRPRLGLRGPLGLGILQLLLKKHRRGPSLLLLHAVAPPPLRLHALLRRLPQLLLQSAGRRHRTARQTNSAPPARPQRSGWKQHLQCAGRREEEIISSPRRGASPWSPRARAGAPRRRARRGRAPPPRGGAPRARAPPPPAPP